MAQAAARLFAAQGVALTLAGRHAGRLDTLAADARTRGAAHVRTLAYEATVDGAEALDALLDDPALPPVDAALVAFGDLPEPEQAATDPAYAMRSFSLNATATLALAIVLGRRFRQQGGGTLAVVTSVAGDRGRASNFVYGASKAAVQTALEGLRQRLFRHGVAVVDIRPGFVDTPMTAHLPKNALYASPDAVGAGIVRAMQRRRSVVYLPFFWRPIMGVIRRIPRPVFNRLSL